MEGRYVTDISAGYRMFTNAGSRTLVHQDLVPPGKVKEGEAVTIRCAHGDVVLYPLAEVGAEVDGKVIKVDAAVSESLPVSVLLGTDVPELTELLKGVTMERAQSDDALVVMTRARAKQQEREEAIEREREQLSGAYPHSLDELGENGQTKRGKEASRTRQGFNTRLRNRRSVRKVYRRPWQKRFGKSRKQYRGVSLMMIFLWRPGRGWSSPGVRSVLGDGSTGSSSRGSRRKTNLLSTPWILLWRN